MGDGGVALFHLLGRDDWAHACAAGIYRPASLETEGFIHFSTDRQLLGSAERFFAGRDDVLVLSVDARKLGPALRFEPVGDKLFPHLYAPLALAHVNEAVVLPLTSEGRFDVPLEWAPWRAYFV